MSRTNLSRAVLALLAGSGLSTAAHAVDLTVLQGNNLVTFDSATPGTVKRTVALSGIRNVGTTTTPQSLLGIDARPLSGGRVLYGVSNTGILYAINPNNGSAAALNVSTTSVPLFASTAVTAVAFDFNPTVDRIRVVGQNGLNLRVSPENGTFTTDMPINGASTSGTTAAAYTNNVQGATTTQLYYINSTTGTLQLSPNANAGTTTVVGPLGTTTTVVNGFDITRGGEAFATLTSATGRTSLYRVNLTTGAAMLVGTVGPSGQFQGLTAGAPAPFAGMTTSANARGVGNALDNFNGAPSAGLLSLFSSLDALPSDAARSAALTQLTPAAYSILPETMMQTNEFVEGTLRKYLRDARSGGTDAGGGAGGQGTTSPIGSFVVMSGRDGRFNARGDRANVDYGATSAIVGLDYRITDSILIGVTGGYDAAEVQLNPISQRSQADTWFVGGYATVGGGGFYTDIVGNYGKTKFDLNRRVAFGTVNSNFGDNVSGSYYGLAATSGFSFDLSGFEAEVYGGARYVGVEIGGITEGFTAPSLSVSEQEATSLQSIAGLRLGADFDVLGASVRPHVRGEWRHEFKNDGPRILAANFATTEARTPFTYTTAPLGQDYALVGVGLTVSGNSPVALVLDYSGQFFGGYRIQSATIGGRFSF